MMMMIPTVITMIMVTVMTTSTLKKDQYIYIYIASSILSLSFSREVGLPCTSVENLYSITVLHYLHSQVCGAAKFDTVAMIVSFLYIYI